MKYTLFTDNLSDLSIPEVCDAVRLAGFDGIDLTLRPGGHVLPEHAGAGLANAQRLATAAGVPILMLSTAVTDVDSPNAEGVFEAAAKAGVTRIKLGYWEYRPFGTLAEQLEEAKKKLDRVVALGRKHRVLPCVHCHSGRLLAAGGFLTYFLLKDHAPSDVGAYVDPMHMTIEGGVSGWEMGLDLLKPWIALAGIKNYRWIEGARDRFGQKRYRWEYVPLEDGQAPLPEFFAILKSISYDGIVSLHSEYKGETSYWKLESPQLIAQSAEDLAYLKRLIARLR